MTPSPVPSMPIGPEPSGTSQPDAADLLGSVAVDLSWPLAAPEEGGSGPAEVPASSPSAPRGQHTLPLWARMTRPSAWPAWSNAIAILGVTLVTLSQLHPSLLLANTTTTGGDTGAHVALAAYLKQNLLTHGRITGWDPSWYDGFPLYSFYFPMPGILTVLVNAVVPYNVAFKFVTVLGSLTLPLCAFLFGRMAKLRDPLPACLAVATLPFLFEPSFTIYGGNLLSTLAGEYSFSLSLSFAMLFLGVVAAGLRTGRYRALAPVLFAMTLLCHLLPALFAIAGAIVWLLLDADLLRSLRTGRAVRAARRRWSRRLGWSILTGVLGVGLAAWWLLPFEWEQAYTTDMGYTKVLGFPHLLFPGSARWLIIADVVALVTMVLRRNRVALFLAIMAALSAGAVCLDPWSKLYNARFLPFWFLCLYLLAGVGLGEVIAAAARFARLRRTNRWVWKVRNRMPAAEGWRPGIPVLPLRRPTPTVTSAGSVVGPLIGLALACLVVVPPLFASLATPLTDIGITPGANQPSAWSNWNYSGYERKPDYPEYNAVVQMMAKVGAEDGCGRTMWEYDASLNRFGTTMALMLLPYWTHGCIDSMEGLLFESASTTPFHFINQSELSVAPSEAITSPAITYAGLNVPLGIQHLQLLGVRYFLASSTTTESAAAKDPNVVEVASSGPWSTSYNGEALNTTWKVYRVDNSALVSPLANQPVVWKNVGPSQSHFLGPAVQWYDHPERWAVVPATGGPSSWPRVSSSIVAPKVVPEPVTHVSGVVQSDQQLSFHVDRIGTPVEVKVSYFPNWHASGAEGPWRVASNMMVVVPTSHEVTLTYGTTSANYLGQAITIISGIAVVALAVLGVRRRRTSR